MSFRVLLLVLAVLCTACMPAVSHGPRVEPGLSGGATAAYPLGPRYMEGDWGNVPFLFGPAGLDVGYGWAAQDPNDAAFRLGLHVPLPIVMLAQVDLYTQAPERWLGGWDAGVGVNGSLHHVMPYLQLGRLGPNGTGWYTTQGVDFLLGRDDTLFGVLWVPGLAYQWRSTWTTTRVFVTSGIGQKYGPCGTSCLPAEPRRVLSLGAALELHRRPRMLSQR